GGVYNRSASSGTQITVARSIMVPANAFMGFNATGTGPMISSVGNGTPAEGTLGFAGCDAVDAARASLNILAYRHWGQNDFWYPDSDSTTFDKRPTRDGHYPVWGYEHALIKLTSAGGTPVSADAAHLVDFLTGAATLPGTLSR